MSLEQIPIQKVWAEDTANKSSFTQAEVGAGINYNSNIVSNQLNGISYQIFLAIQFLQHTGGLYNAIIPYINPNIASLVTYNNGAYGLNFYIRLITNPTSTTNNPPITGASISSIDGIDIYAGGSANSDWQLINSNTAYGFGAPATTPIAKGLYYIDITNHDLYFSIDTSSSADWIHSKEIILTGTSDPASTPSFIGQRYVNTTTGKMFMSVGTDGAWNWGYIGTGSVSSFNKDTVAGLKVWLRADVGVTKAGGSDAVSQWGDQSGNGNNVIQLTGSAQPIWYDALFNGYPAIEFDGVNDDLHNVSFSLAQPYTIFAVVEVLTVNSAQHIIVTGGTAILPLEVSPVNNYENYVGEILADGICHGTIDLVTSVGNGDNSSIKQNNSDAVTGSAGSSSLGLLQLGSSINGTYYCKMRLAELLIYDSALSSPNKTIVWDYLNSRYDCY